jgi:predicted RNA-binding protein associated with RNAse of E/G family
MSISNDIHDVEWAIKNGHKITPSQAKDALKAFRSILARLNRAEQHEDRLVDVCNGFDMINDALAADGKWRKKPKGKRR